MLQPARTKFRKAHKGRIKGKGNKRRIFKFWFTWITGFRARKSNF